MNNKNEKILDAHTIEGCYMKEHQMFLLLKFPKVKKWVKNSTGFKRQKEFIKAELNQGKVLIDVVTGTIYNAKTLMPCHSKQLKIIK